MSSRVGRWLAAGVVAALGTAVAGGLKLRKPGPAYSFETVKVGRGKIAARVTATGVLSAIVTVQVGSQVSGRIQAIHVDYNSPVRKGELIAKIDPQIYEATLEQARANEIAAKANLDKSKVQAAFAQRDLARQRQLFERRLIAQADFDTATANAEAAAAQVEASLGALEQAKAARELARVNLEYTSIDSPINGTVISRAVDVGQTVAASLAAPTLFTIAEDLRKMQVDTSVAEGDVGKLKDGMLAKFNVDAYPNDTFVGRIRQIRNAPQTVQNVVTYDAVIDVANGDLRLRPGMTANVTVVYAEKDDALKIPNAALRFRPPPGALSPKVPAGPDGSTGSKEGSLVRSARAAEKMAPKDLDATPDRRKLYRLTGGRPEPVAVRIGLSDGTNTEVVDGPLAPGDELITEMKGGEAKGPGSNPFRRVF